MNEGVFNKLDSFTGRVGRLLDGYLMGFPILSRLVSRSVCCTLFILFLVSYVLHNYLTLKREKMGGKHPCPTQHFIYLFF